MCSRPPAPPSPAPHEGIQLVLNSRVASVGDGMVSVINKANETEDIPFGACVWATGIAMNPLVRTMQPLLPGQNHFRCGGAGGQANYCHMPLFFLSPCACSILTLHITLPLFLLAGLS